MGHWTIVVGNIEKRNDVRHPTSRHRLVKLALVIAALSLTAYIVRAVLQGREGAQGKVSETAASSALPDRDQAMETESVAIVPGDIDFVKIPYSIFRNDNRPAAESAVERSKLPEFKVIPGLEKTFTNAVAGPAHFDSWMRSHGDDFSSKFSELGRINKANVKTLKPAWVYRSGEDKRIGNVETNPVVANGRIYVTSPAGFLLSIDAASGAEKWRTQIKGAARRGLTFWPGNQQTPARLFVPSIAGTYAINPEDGSKIATFGEDGRAGSASLIAPVVDGDRLIVATLTPSVEAFDVESGRIIWKRELLKEENIVSKQTGAPVYRIGAGVPWAGMSLDRARSKLYVSTGNPRPALYGATRLGPNELSSSVVCVDTRSGAIAWSFQEVAHDLWDFDVPSPPILTTIHRNGLPVDVVAAVTKIGNTVLLERDSGRPVFDYRLKRAPVSDVPGEETAPYQPALELPEPFMKQSFEISDITDLGADQRTSVEQKVRGAQFGFFPPPSVNNKVVVFGLHGGAEWPGGAVNQKTGILYVPSNQLPWTLRLHYADSQNTPAANIPYQQKCAGCHGNAREGFYETEFSGDKTYPSLVGISARKAYDLNQFQQDHSGASLPDPVSGADLEQINQYLHEADSVSDRRGSLKITGIWQLLLDRDKYPGSRPPWGMITAIDLNSGKRLWQVPFGEYAELTQRGIPSTGQPNFGGLLATGAGLVFATGTIDRKIRALDADTGKQLWEYELPAAGSAPPSTYEIDGVQYLVVVATGGIFAGFKERSDAIMAFRLADQ